jgi:hypothetical protein
MKEVRFFIRLNKIVAFMETQKEET